MVRKTIHTLLKLYTKHYYRAGTQTPFLLLLKEQVLSRNKYEYLTIFLVASIALSGASSMVMLNYAECLRNIYVHICPHILL